MSEFQFVEVLPGAPFKTVKSPNRQIRPDTQMLIDFAEALRSRTLAFREGYAAGHKRGIQDLSGIIERAFMSAREEIREAKEQVRDV